METCMNLVLTAGQMLLESGAETYRAEEAGQYMFHALEKGEIHIYAIPTMIIISITTEDGKNISGSRRIRSRSVHMEKIDKINDIARKTAEGALSCEEALVALSALDAKKSPPAILAPFYLSVAAGFFSFLLFGGIQEFFFAFLCCFLSQSIALFFQKVSMYQVFSSVLGGFVPSLIMHLFGKFVPGLDAQVVIIASMLPLFPGVATINAIRDAIGGDLNSAVARAAEAILLALGLGLGASIIYL